MYWSTCFSTPWGHKVKEFSHNFLFQMTIQRNAMFSSTLFPGSFFFPPPVSRGQEKESPWERGCVVISKFDNHFALKRNVIHERAMFNKRDQLSDESAESFIRVLYEMARRTLWFHWAINDWTNFKLVRVETRAQNMRYMPPLRTFASTSELGPTRNYSHS